MFKQVLLLAAGFIAGAIAVNAIPSRAQPYLGVRVLQSTQKPVGTGHNCDYATYTSCNDRFRTFNLYGGYSFGNFALEAGGGSLGRRTSHNVSTQYDIHQDIDTKHIYAAGLYRFDMGKISPHVLFGVDRVWMDNHEYGWNVNGPNQEQRNSSFATRPLIGTGLSYSLGKAELRADVFMLKKIACSHWTGTSDVLAVSVGLQVTL